MHDIKQQQQLDLIPLVIIVQHIIFRQLCGSRKVVLNKLYPFFSNFKQTCSDTLCYTYVSIVQGLS